MIIVLQMLIFFRQSLVATLDRLIRPYYKHFSLSLPFYKYEDGSGEEDSEEQQVFAEFDDEKGVVFFPPMYSQRYAAVCDCLMDEKWKGKLEKVVDLGYHDISFIKYLKDVPGIKCILGVDLESIPLRCSPDLFYRSDNLKRDSPLKITPKDLGYHDISFIKYLKDVPGIKCILEVDLESIPLRCSPDLFYRSDHLKRDSPLKITLFQGNAADPDYRLIGCDAVIAIEMIEHMLPHDLDRIIHTVFGFIKPWIAVFTTPNADFNVLFKALEANGLRRLDHFFEWTREQFNDWCSNIVTRYPQYTVSCKGIGPGPPGTEHLGCCSQLALFVSKDYHKQQELNLNSLAIVGNISRSDNKLLTETIGDWISPEYITSLRDITGYDTLQSTSNMLLTYPSTETINQLLVSNKPSCWTIVIASPVYSMETQLHDKTSQCNIDTEVERNFLMFNDMDMCFTLLMPQRKIKNKIYEIQDVASRLNCTSLQVRKFSRTSQGMIAKHQIEDNAHVREVVDRVQGLTKMLNLKKENLNQALKGAHTWFNFNWGDNAPYWNQFYKAVGEYNYPFEVKSDESQILDLISAEISRQVDLQYNEEFAVSGDILEIPIAHLMEVVKNFTDDIDRVRDVLEWNGYEVVDNKVIYRRLIADEKWPNSLDDMSLIQAKETVSEVK